MFANLIRLAKKIADRLRYPNWRNYSCEYKAISKAELIAKIRKAKEHLTFYPPLEE